MAARYLPATRGMDIGGDFYDLIRLGPTTAAAAIGDVQGHNVNAAALMGQVRTAVHATAGAAPDEVLARTNRLLTDLDPDLFTSCLYVHLDLGAHTACLATAGHPPPLLRHPDGTTEPLRLPPGLLLGIDPDAGYASTEIPLPPGPSWPSTRTDSSKPPASTSTTRSATSPAHSPAPIRPAPAP